MPIPLINYSRKTSSAENQVGEVFSIDNNCEMTYNLYQTLCEFRSLIMMMKRKSAMAKICKSCGNYYNGDFCDKCGYGKKVGSSKAARKYKKATKPERFRTDEEKAVYAKWEQEKRQEKSQARVKSNSGIKFVAVLAIAVVVVVVFALYKSGVIFSNTRSEVVENYFDAIQSGDYNKFIKCFPDEIRNDYEEDRKNAGLSKEEYLGTLYGDFAETYGDDYEISVELGRETELSSEDYDMTEYSEQYGSAPKISEVYEIAVTVTFKGSKSSEEAHLYINVAKTSGYWRIFNITQDTGIVDESTGLAEQTEE